MGPDPDDGGWGGGTIGPATAPWVIRKPPCAGDPLSAKTAPRPRAPQLPPGEGAAGAEARRTDLIWPPCHPKVTNRSPQQIFDSKETNSHSIGKRSRLRRRRRQSCRRRQRRRAATRVSRNGTAAPLADYTGVRCYVALRAPGTPRVHPNENKMVPCLSSRAACIAPSSTPPPCPHGCCSGFQYGVDGTEIGVCERASDPGMCLPSCQFYEGRHSSMAGCATASVGSPCAAGHALCRPGTPHCPDPTGLPSRAPSAASSQPSASPSRAPVVPSCYRWQDGKHLRCRDILRLHAGYVHILPTSVPHGCPNSANGIPLLATLRIPYRGTYRSTRSELWISCRRRHRWRGGVGRGTVGYSSCAGASRFKLLWDITNLYIAVDVDDATPQQDSGASHWEDDSIEVP
eukprot:gene18009-biopygen35557